MSYESARKYSFSHELVGLKIIVSSFCLRFLLYLFSFNVDLNISHCIWIQVLVCFSCGLVVPKQYTSS